MDLVILGLAAVAVAFFLPIFLLFRTQKMKDQIAALERSVKEMTTGAPVTDAPEAPETEEAYHEDKKRIYVN